MSSFKRVENEEEMTSQSRRRPLVFETLKASDHIIENQVSSEGDQNGLKMSKKHEESLEKGAKEIEQQSSMRDSEKNQDSEELQNDDELSNIVDDILELTKFGNSGRRLTTDSGITSRGSSFSSEPDISITEESIKEMKEYLHGKADALYQPYEHEKLKDIKDSDIEIIVAKSQNLSKKEQAKHSTKQIMSMASLRKEKYDTDHINELEASVLAGMYLFDRGPSDHVDEYRSGLPALELLVRKEAFENISDRETAQSEFEELEDKVTKCLEKSQNQLEYQAAEIISEKGHDESDEVEKLNAINIERSQDIVIKLEETSTVKAKTVICVEEGDREDEAENKTDKRHISNNMISSETDSLTVLHTEATELEADSRKDDNSSEGYEAEKQQVGLTELAIISKEGKDSKASYKASTDDSTGKDHFEFDAASFETKEGEEDGSRISSSCELDQESKVKDDSALNVDVSVNNEEMKEFTKDDSLLDTALDEYEQHLIEHGNDNVDLSTDERSPEDDNNISKVETKISRKVSDDDTHANLTDALKCEKNEKNANSPDGLRINHESDLNESSSAHKTDAEVWTGRDENTEINDMEYDVQMNEKSGKSQRELVGDKTDRSNDEGTSGITLTSDSRSSLDRDGNDDKVDIQSFNSLTVKEQSKDISKDTPDAERKAETDKRDTIEDKGRDETFADVITKSELREQGDHKNEKRDENTENKDELANDNLHEGIEWTSENDPYLQESNNVIELETKIDDNSKKLKTIPDEIVNPVETVNVTVSPTDDNIKQGLCDKTEAEGKDMIFIDEDEKRFRNKKDRQHKINSDISGDEIDDAREVISQQDKDFEEQKRVEDAKLEAKEHAFDKTVNEAVNSVKNDSNNKSTNEYILYSANEDSDAGRHFTEPLKDSDLIYLVDTHPEIPNVINIIDNMKENEIRKKDTSLTEQIENKTVTVNSLSENSILVASVKETQSAWGTVKSVNEMNLATLESEQSLNENTPLVHIAETGPKVCEGLTDDKSISVENAKKTQTIEITESNESQSYSEVDELTGEKLQPHLVDNIDTTVLKIDKLEAYDATIVDTVKEVEQEVTEESVIPENAKTKSVTPNIKSNIESNIKTKTSTLSTSSEVVEELIVPVRDTKDEKIPDLQNVELIKKKNIVSKDKEDSQENNTLAGDGTEYIKDQKTESVEDKQKKSFDSTTDIPLVHDKPEHVLISLVGDNSVHVPEGCPVKLQWKVTGVELSNVNVYKDGQKVRVIDNLRIDADGDVYSLTVANVTVDDEATYSVRTQDSKKDNGEIRVKVTATAEEKHSTKPEEPKFIVEPVIDVKDGRRLSIKCSVTGLPAPQVTWYHHGQQLDQSALWDIYSKDGYNYLSVGDPSIMDCEEIVCRVENDLGYVQRVVSVKRDGDEVYCEPVLPPVSPEPAEDMEISPSIEIEISEIVTTNLRQLQLASDYRDSLNFVTLNSGDIVEVLACATEGSVLARDIPHKEKVCYIPKQVLAVSNDVSSQVCEKSAIKNNISLTEKQLQENKEEAAMPERRKMKSPSPKMTSTPKVKRKEMDTESTEELQKRLGYSDNLAQRKEFSTPDSVEFTEYNDGTTRPMFKKRLKSVTAKSGETAQLECTVSGSPLPKILWLKNNRPLKASDGCKVIVDDGTNILVFPKARDEDVGIYTARAMNVNGSIMCSAEFTLSDGRGLPAQPVTDSPMDMDFTTPAYFFQMSSCEVSEGRLARFDCRVVAYPKPEIVWMRDGKVIEAEQRFKLLNFNNEIYSLLIQDVRTEDTGRYTCWARNKFGEAMTEAYLNVLALADQEPEGDLAPKFLTRFYDQQTTEGTSTDFKCLIAGRPEPSVTWLLDDLEIREGQGVRMRHKDGMVSLEIKSPKVDQSGTYTCQLSNPLGEATCSARLTVVEDKLHGKMLPKFLKKFDHVTVKEGEEANFTAVIIGEPRPDVMWLYDHKPISDTNRRFMMKKEGDAYTLTIRNVRFDDGGKITCKASNEEGEVYCSANLHVRESKFMTDLPEKIGGKSQDEVDSKFGYIPTFTKRLQDLEVKEGSRATFECRVMGIPDPEISWMKDGRVITPGGRYRMTFEGGTGQLVIDNATAADTGVYTCIVSNSQGKSSSTAALKLEEPKKERYTPDRLLEERTSRKERYTPDKYLLDDSTAAKRPYLDTDRYEAKGRKSYESPLSTVKLEDTYLTRPKKKYDSPKSSYESFKPKYDTSFESPKLSYESPLKQYDSTYTRLESPVRQYDTYTRYESPGRQYDSFTRYESPVRQFDTYTRFESPVRQYDTYKRYESPIRQYDSVSTKYESPFRPYESISTRYESPVRQLDSSYTRYESPVRMYDTAKPLYESPRRRSSIGREEKIKAIPKMPFDRPALLNKREDSVQLSWLPAPTYSLPDDARHVSYVIESREIPSRDWSKVATSVPGTTYTVRHLRPDKEYEFRVRAQNTHGVSEPTWNATLDKRVDETSKQLDLPEMRAPPRLPTHRPIITDFGEETMRLAWRPVETYQAKRTPPVSYRLEAKELPGRDWMPLSSHLRDTSHYLPDLLRDRDYMIRVRAENDFGISEPTEPLWIPRAKAFPGVPVTRPEIIDYEDTMAKLSWSRVDIPAFGLDDTPLLYMLEVEEPPYKNWRTIARDLDDTEYIVEGLKPGHDYRFRVRAKTPTGIVSEPSPAVSLYTKLAQTRAPVDRLEVLDYEPETRSVRLSWDRVNIPPYDLDDEPLMYMLEYQEPPLPDWKTLVTGIPTTRYRVMHLDRDRDYNFRVRALTPYGVSQPSPTLPVTLRQPTGTPVTRGLPEKVIISEVEAHSLRLTWRRPMYDLDKPIGYQVEMLESPFSDWRPIATRVMDTTYKVTGLKPTRDYQFRVIPQLDTEYLAPTPSAALTTMPVKPRLPYGEPRLKELTPESVQLSWSSAELPAYQRKRSPIHYKVEMAELPSNNWVPVARKVGDTSYTVTGLRPNQEYKFRVFAESDSGLSEPSMPTTLYRRPAPRFPLKEPIIRDLSQNVVHLAWSPAEIPTSGEAVTYMVEVQTPPGISSWNTLYRQHPTPSVRLADLRPDLDYLVRVRAQSGTYLSEPTLPVYIPRRAAPPRLPVEQPYAVEINPDFVKLQWRSADLPTHIQDYAPVTYRLEAQELPDTNWVSIARGIPYTDFKVTGLNPQRDYNFRVRAENEYGLSDPTHPMMIRKRAVPPTLPTYEPMLYDIGPGSARLSWRPATLPSFMPQTPITYTLFVQDLPYKTWRPLVKGIPHTSYYVSGLQPDKEYLFRVQAENQYGSSKPTDSIRLPRYKDYTRPISVPEVSDFDEDLTSVKLRWMPTRVSPPFDTKPRKYTIETWEPVRREWKPVARGVPDTTYQIRGLPKLPDHLFRVRMDTEEPALSEPSMPVSLSRYSLPRAPMYRPQLYELEDESVRLSWQPVSVPEGVSRRSVRYTIEQREIPEPRWSPIATDIMETSHKVRGLRPKSDYEFRVKAMFDGISTEPSYPVSLFRRAVIPKVKLDAPEVYDVEDTSLSLRWNTVDVPAFTPDEEPLLFVIERQTLPSYEWQPVATNISDRSYTIRDLQPYQDYNFRVRGVYPSGYTEPSPYVPVYRRPIRLSVPVARTEVWEEEPTSARLRWHRAYIPRYYSSTPISYRIEMQEAGETDKEWKPVATDITTPDYTVRNISPRKDYRFRIRAKTENGDISEPTPPISFYRTQVPLMKDREQALADYKPVEYKAIFLKHPYYEVLTKYVPPSMPIHKPDMIIIDTETVEINWRPAIVAEAIKYTCNLTYTIEVRCPPSFEWRQLVSGLKICSHTIQKLHPRIDYVFRVRAWNEYGCSEASLPVSLYRPAVYKIEGEEEMDDEEFEIEWKRRYGREDDDLHLETVPPKLPIDTPRIVTQSSDSIWFTWLPARIPAYATQTSINYVVEIREPPSTAWQRDATDLVDCQYVKEGLNPNQEYHIRVRAETEFGASDPTMPIIIRGKGSRPGSRRSSVEREERGLEDKIDLSYLDNVMSGVPPRMASSRPLSSCVGPDKLTLSWSPCRTPSYVKASNVTYIIEKRELPGHVWTVLAKDITGHKYDITGLNPEQDYMFRIRARNEFGLSEPTLPMTLYRERDDYVPPKVRSRSGSRDSISMYVSKVMRRSSSVDYSNLQMEDDRSSQERIPCQPQYIPMTYDTQYGVLGKKGKISLEVRGYPLPTVHWYKGEEKIEYGGQFNAFVTPRGGITLEIKNVGLDTVGEYKCYAENASGAAVKMVNFEIAEPPTVLGTIKDLFAFKGDSVTLTCRVDGFPSPTVKWMKDWRPLTDCTRTKMVNVPPETFSLEIVQLIESDEGLYACTVENIAGKVTVTGRLNVEIDSFPEREITIKSTPIEEQYHVLEEIGRGRYGVVRRVVEISTGRTFAANFMSMRNKAQKNFFKTEFEVLRSISKMGGVLKLYDAFETDRSLVLVTEILSEPELLEKVISDGNWTEARVANIIRKLLAILQDLARLNILHLDIKPSNIRTCGTELEDIKLIGFGLSRILQPDEEIMHNYGSVGYASPEQVTNDVLMPNTDMWAVGVLAYLLLSGNGPFQGSSEIEILNFMSECSWTFEGRGFEKFSKEGLDFISKLLVKDPRKRMTVEECLNHPWMSTQSDAKINTEQLKQFYTAEKLQRETEKVFTTVQLQSFAKIIHGTKALYQPAVDIESGEIIFPDSDEYGDYLDEDAWYEWQLQYNDDPDSQNFPIQDKKFTVRECRHAGAPKYSKPKPKERSDTDILDTGTGILFTDKIQPTTFLEGEDVIFTATVVSETGEIPVVTWYRDEQLLSDDYRAEASFSPDTGLAKLKIVKSKDYDAAVYKCVARIKEGRVSCEARLLLGDVPSKPGCPLVAQTSGTEAFLTWNAPVSDGNTYLLGYRVDYRKEGDKKWTNGPYVTEEFALVTGLEPETSYIFRVSGHNSYGASPFSWSSLDTKTLGKDAPKVTVAADLQPLLQFSTFDKQQLILPAESRRPSVTVTEEAKVNESDPTENFAFADTISKGSYGEYKLCTNKTTSRQCVAKIVPYSKENHSAITAEFELLRKLRHANLVAVLDSYISGEHFYVIYEFLSGINIVQHLCLHKTYKEETVARLVRQVLDALQYLEHYGIVHLNLQPSSIVMATRRRPHVKLRDFTLARKVEDDKGIKVPLAGYPDYTSPEILKGDSVTFTADLWTLGALTFTMLSGISPFGGKNLEETLSRVLFDRYSTKEMYDNVTEESIKFVQKLLCRLPRNRPTVTKCLNSSWLSLSESMVNARNTKIFKSEKLRAFSVDYLNKRSDINYSLALVDIEKLPKITPGPLVQPVLSEKITNRLENLTKIKREHTSLADSLKTEVSSLPEQPLLEKIVSKIERESENIDKTEVQTVKEESKTSKTTIAEVGGEISDVKITEEEKKVTLAKAQEEIVEGDIDTFEDKESIPTEAEVQKKINETEILSSGTEVGLEVKEHNAVDIKKEIKDDIVVETEMNERIEKTEENIAGTKAEVDTTELKDAESVEQIEKKITPDALEPKDIDSKPEKDKVVVEDTENVDAIDKTEIVEMKENLVMKDMEMNDENIETKNLENLEEITKKSDVVDAELVKVEKVSETSKITEQLIPGDIESNLIENKEHVDVTEMRETVENKVDMKKISDGQEKDIVVDNKSQKDIKVEKELAEGTEETQEVTEETSDVKLIMKSEGERKDIDVEIESKETKKTKDELQKTEFEAASIEKTKAKEEMLIDADLIEKKEGESKAMMVEKKIGDTESKETDKTMGELQKTELTAASVEQKKAKEEVLLDAELIEKKDGESKTMKEEKKIGEEIKTKEELLKSGVKETIDEKIKTTEKEVLDAGLIEKKEDKSTVLRDEPLEVNEIEQTLQKEDVEKSVIETTQTTDGEILDAGLIEEKEKEISAETEDNKIREMVDEKFEKSDVKESSDKKETTEDENKDMSADNKEILTTNVKDQLQKETLSKEIQEVVEKDKADIKERELQTTYVEETKESKETSENIGKVKGTELDQIVETAITEVQKEVISERNEETVIETDVTSERKVLKDITSALSQNESFEASEEKINFTEEKEEITDKSLGLQRINEVNTQQQGQAIIENETVTEKEKDSVITSETVSDKISETEQITKLEQQENELSSADKSLSQTVSSETKEVSKEVGESSTGSKGCEIEAKIQTEKKEIVETKLSENLKQDLSLEIVEKQTEILHDETKSTVFHDKSKQVDSEIKSTTTCDTDELISGVSELAEREAKEIKRAAFEEIATVLKASKETEDLNVQKQEEIDEVKEKITISDNETKTTLKQADEIKNLVYTEDEIVEQKSSKEVETKKTKLATSEKSVSEYTQSTEVENFSKDECVSIAMSKMVSEKVESVSVVKEETSDFISVEKKEETLMCLSEKDITETEESDKVETMSASETKESLSEVEEKQISCILENVEKEVQAETSEGILSTDSKTSVESVTMKDETASASALVTEQVDGTVTEKITVSKKHESLAVDGHSAESAESVSSMSTMETQKVEESCILESTGKKEVVSEQRQESLSTGNMVLEKKEAVEMVSTSLVEDLVVQSSVSSSLETARVTESRETVREFVTNDDEIEEMKKEILEDLEITSAECGKYLMGSHEDISAIKEKIEMKPDEEEIEKETTNRYIDDALMFC